jgi:hypothetical protein
MVRQKFQLEKSRIGSVRLDFHGEPAGTTLLRCDLGIKLFRQVDNVLAMPDLDILTGSIQHGLGCIVANIARVRQSWVAQYRSTAQRDNLEVESKA